MDSASVRANNTVCTTAVIPTYFGQEGHRTNIRNQQHMFVLHAHSRPVYDASDQRNIVATSKADASNK